MTVGVLPSHHACFLLAEVSNVAYEINPFLCIIWLHFSEVDLFHPVIENIFGRGHIHILQPIMAQGAAAEVLTGDRAQAVAEAEARPQDNTQEEAEAEASLQYEVDTLENPMEIGLPASELHDGDDTYVTPIIQILFEDNVNNRNLF